MENVLNSFINEHKLVFNEYFNNHIDNKLKNREDYKKITDEIQSIYNKYPNIRAFIEDEIPMTFGKEETEAFSTLYNLYDNLNIIELLEAFKLGGKEAYIFFEEQGMLNI